MTRNDYEILARAMRAAHDAPHDAPTFALVAGKIADAMGAQNARFDRERFFGACGIGGRK